MMFPRHTDHHNAGCDKPDNSPLCQAALFLEEWVLEKQDIPFCFGWCCFVCHTKKTFNLSHLIMCFVGGYSLILAMGLCC